MAPRRGKGKTVYLGSGCLHVFDGFCILSRAPMPQEVELLGAKPCALRSKGHRMSRSPSASVQKGNICGGMWAWGPTNSQSP